MSLTLFPSLFLQQQPANSVLAFAPYILIALVFYFLLFLPMQKQKKKQQQMLNELKSGDVVLTNGGIKGTVTSVDTETVVLRTRPDNVKLEFARSAVNALVPPDVSK